MKVLAALRPAVSALPDTSAPSATWSMSARSVASVGFAGLAFACASCAGGTTPPPALIGSDSVLPAGGGAASLNVPPSGDVHYGRPEHPTPSPALLVLAKKDEMLSIVDPATLAVVARIPVGHDPHEVIASSDGHFAYVSNYGRGAYDTLAVADLAEQKPMPPIKLGALRGPHGLRYVRDHVWFTAEAARAVASYDPETHAVDWILGTGQDRTHMLLVSPDTKRIVTTNVNSGTMSFLDRLPPGAHPMSPPPDAPAMPDPSRGPGGAPPGGPSGVMGAKGAAPPAGPSGPPGGDWQESVVQVGAGTEGFDASPDGRELWAADAQDGAVIVVDSMSKKVAQRVMLGIVGANRLKFTPDGKWVLVSSLRSGDLVVIDARTRAIVQRIPIGHGAAGIQLAPDGHRAFVSCSPDGYVAVIDTATWTVAGNIPVGHEPDGLAWAVRR